LLSGTNRAIVELDEELGNLEFRINYLSKLFVNLNKTIVDNFYRLQPSARTLNDAFF
jgi:hypothetical protein